MKKIHISDNDLDGVSALFLSNLAFKKEELKVIASTTRAIDSLVESIVENEWDKETLLIITDLSIDSRQLADKIDRKVKEGYSIALIDHHPTAFWLNDYSWATVVNVENGEKTSATTMYLDFLKQQHALKESSIVDDYAELVRSYDTWDWWYVGVEVEGKIVPNYRSKRLNDLLYIVGKDYFEKMVLEKLNSKIDAFHLDEKEEFLLDIEQYRIEEYIEKKKKELKVIPFVLDKEYQTAVIIAETHVSELGNVICREREDVDFVSMIDVGKGKISFRASKSHVDVSVVAKAFDGGGHASASGCDLNETTIPVFLKPFL